MITITSDCCTVFNIKKLDKGLRQCCVEAGRLEDQTPVLVPVVPEVRRRFGHLVPDDYGLPIEHFHRVHELLERRTAERLVC